MHLLLESLTIPHIHVPLSLALLLVTTVHFWFIAAGRQFQSLNRIHAGQVIFMLSASNHNCTMSTLVCQIN